MVYNPINKQLIVITGGVGSGKTTLIKLLESLGFPCLQADTLVHEVYRQNPNLTKEIFGQELTKQDIAKLIFSDKDAMKQLTDRLYPLMEELFNQKVASITSNVIFYEIPLYFERLDISELPSMVDTVIVVTAPQELQIERTMARDGKTAEQVVSIINNQLPLDRKCELANFIVDSTKDMKGQILRILDEMGISLPN